MLLIKETGAGLADANAYAEGEDSAAYHEMHLYASAWTGSASEEVRLASLQMATRLIDASFKFNGVRAVAGQALAWPRRLCPDPDTGGLVAFNAVPKAVVDATCELARELLIVDRTAAPPGEGKSYENIAGSQTGYNKSDTRPIIPAVVQAMLAKFGTLIKTKSGSVKLVRV